MALGQKGGTIFSVSNFCIIISLVIFSALCIYFGIAQLIFFPVLMLLIYFFTPNKNFYLQPGIENPSIKPSCIYIMRHNFQITGYLKENDHRIFGNNKRGILNPRADEIMW